MLGGALEVIPLFYRKETIVRVYTLVKATVLWGQKLEPECRFAGHSLCLFLYLLLISAKTPLPPPKKKLFLVIKLF